MPADELAKIEKSARRVLEAMNDDATPAVPAKTFIDADPRNVSKGRFADHYEPPPDADEPQKKRD